MQGNVFPSNNSVYNQILRLVKCFKGSQIQKFWKYFDFESFGFRLEVTTYHMHCNRRAGSCRVNIIIYLPVTNYDAFTVPENCCGV